MVLQGLEWVDFSGSDSFFRVFFSGYDRSFGYWTGFLRNGYYDFFKDWKYWFFLGLEFFSQIEIKNGLSTFLQDIEFYAFPPFQRTAYIY